MRTIYIKLLICIFLSIAGSGLSPAPSGLEGENLDAGRWLSGYERAMEGHSFSYHSPLPDTKSALLVRANAHFPSIAWETAKVPLDHDALFVHFIWVFGIDADPDVRTFALHVNGNHCLSFQNPAQSEIREWTVDGEQGASLKFKVTLKDRYNDLMGFAALTLPAEMVEQGEPVRLEVIGEAADRPVWYMTFQRSLNEQVTIEQAPAIVRKGDETFHEVYLDLLHMDEPLEVEIRTEETGNLRHLLSFGLNRIPLLLTPVEEPKEIALTIRKRGKVGVERSFTQQPVRKWTVYLVQHSHTDIGYTRPQTEILPEHLRFIDFALDYCDLTDDYPEEAKFRWTCEASWPVREYLKSRPAEQIARLKQRVQEGRIELTGMMFNMSEIPDEPSFSAFLSPLKEFKALGLPVRSAMQNDVNGVAWCLADYFPAIGIEYLIMGQHPHRALTCFKKPTAFWWASPAGSRVLAFRADHYMTANRWGINQDGMESFHRELLAYLQDLEIKGYPFDEIEVQYSGYFTDNAPPSTAGCDKIAAWNQSYAWPRLQSATIHQFMDRIKEEHGADLPVHRAAWPDWWSDGFGSAARETAAARRTHVDLTAIQGLFALAAWLGPGLPHDLAREIPDAYDALLFYDEHTFGAAESISAPLGENSLVQWGEKSASVWEAVKKTRLLQEKALGLLQPHLRKGDEPTITVFNTLDWERSGMVELYVDHQIVHPDRDFRVVDPRGNRVPVQHLSRRSDGSYWALWTEQVPAMGYRTYRIESRDEPRPAVTACSDTVLENEFFRIEIDPEIGAIERLRDKELDLDLVDPEAPWGFLTMIYEELSDRRQLEQFRLTGFERTPWEEVRILEGADGELWKSLVMEATIKGGLGEDNVRCEIRLHHHARRIGFHFTLRKEERTDPEGIYVAFPFRLPDSEIVYEAQGGMVVPGKDQLPGSSSDWHTVQNAACVRNDQAQIILVSHEIPLMQFGEINLGKFQYIAEVERPHLYSWVMNNYWTTNFRASQDGEFKWHYDLTCTSDTSNLKAARFGWGSRVPLMARVLPSGVSNGTPLERSLFQEVPSHLLLVSTQPSDDGKKIIFHWRETDGIATTLDLESLFEGKGFQSFHEVNLLGEPLETIDGPVSFGPFEVKVIEAGLP